VTRRHTNGLLAEVIDRQTAQMPENVFVGDIARSYDATAAAMASPELLERTTRCLLGLAAGGPLLEFAIGTGRVSVPLARLGADISGIELSTDMIDELRAKPGAATIPVVHGDMATAVVDRTFSVVFLVFNTITNLTTQAEQVACFKNAARHLRPGGRFVIETFVPALRRLAPGNAGFPFTLTDDYIGLEEFVDLTHVQRSRSRHLVRQEDGSMREFAASFRYVWPSELDLMGQLAGMSLEHRWADWDRSPFTGDSPAHVSVWQLTDTVE
jgi:SAM-dependent methyltransferase